MNTQARQRGALIVMAMFLLAGVAAIGGSLAKMQVSGLDVAAEHSGNNTSFNLAETAIQVGLKQFKDAECDPSQVIGAAAEATDGSTTVTQSLGEIGNVKLIFCPMDGTCFPPAYIPDDEDVNQAETEAQNPPETGYHPHWHRKYGKHAGWYHWISYRKHYRYHHWRHTDKKEHWRHVQRHRKNCHGPFKRHHNNYDYRCMAGGEFSAEDSVNYWMVTAKDANSENQRSVTQLFSCESGPENTGNLFTGNNYTSWNPKAMVTQGNGKATFGASSGTNMKIEATDMTNLTLPEDGGQDVWFHGTFKVPATSGSFVKFTLTARDPYYWGATRTYVCGDKGKPSDGIVLTKTSQTIRCDQIVWSDVRSRIEIRCDGTVDPDCNISQGKLHFNLGKLDTARVKSIRFDGKNAELNDAFLGNKDGGTEATAKPNLTVGQWYDDL
ncbi:MAG: hypothetical protein G8237_14695 [Magnetococcales bacterium]|nr:hypothetical protein [Magnetococcales bacterium]